MSSTLIVLAFTTLTAVSIAPFDSNDTACPSGLPAQLFLDCVVADSSARSVENGPAHIGAAEYYNVSEQLQAWADTQMRRDAARELTLSTDSDIAQQVDLH